MEKKRSLGLVILSIYLFVYGFTLGGRLLSDSLLRFKIVDFDDFILKLQFLGSVVVLWCPIYLLLFKESARQFTIKTCMCMIGLTLCLWGINYRSPYIAVLIMLGIPTMTLLIPIIYLSRPKVKALFSPDEVEPSLGKQFK